MDGIASILEIFSVLFRSIRLELSSSLHLGVESLSILVPFSLLRENSLITFRVSEFTGTPRT